MKIFAALVLAVAGVLLLIAGYVATKEWKTWPLGSFLFSALGFLGGIIILVGSVLIGFNFIGK